MVTKIITEDQWKKLKQETLFTAFTILDAVEVLIENTHQPNMKAGVPIICTALYTHIIEELGKIFYLRTLVPNQGTVEINYDNRFKDHKTKFSLSLDCLPDRVLKLHEGDYGNDFGGNYHIDTMADWETRLNIFNTDFYDNGEVKRYPLIDPEKLRSAIFHIRTILYSIKID